MVTLGFLQHCARRLPPFLSVLALFATMPLLAHGATYYVNKSGRDSNSCAQATSRSTAKLTISSSLACMAGGDTLIIGDGTYVEAISNTIPSGRAGAPTTISAENRNQVILRPNAPSGFYVIAFTLPASYITIDGIVADAINTQSVSYYLSTNAGTIHDIILKNGSAINSKNEPVQGVLNGAYGSGIRIGHHSNVAGHYNCQVLNMDVSGNQEHGIYISAHDNIIDGNRIHNNGMPGNWSDYSLHLYTSSSVGVDNNVIRNNTITDGADYGAILSGGRGNLFYNNIISGHSKSGLILNYASSNAQIYNNTIYRNGDYALLVAVAALTGHIIRNNIFWMNTVDAIGNPNSLAVTVSNNLVGVNPSFANTAGADFSLLSGSPAIGTGMDLSAVFTTDMVGKTREGTVWDIGAVGYLRSTQPVSPPTNLRVIGSQ